MRLAACTPFHQSCGSWASGGGLVPAQFTRLDVCCSVATVLPTEVTWGVTVVLFGQALNAITTTVENVAATINRVPMSIVVILLAMNHGRLTRIKCPFL